MDISGFARQRMTRGGLTLDHLRYIMDNSDSTYATKGAVVHKGTLPDGRVCKVRSEGDQITDVVMLGRGG